MKKETFIPEFLQQIIVEHLRYTGRWATGMNETRESPVCMERTF